jgi:hypothetical protein
MNGWSHDNPIIIIGPAYSILNDSTKALTAQVDENLNAGGSFPCPIQVCRNNEICPYSTPLANIKTLLGTFSITHLHFSSLHNRLHPQGSPR